MEMILKQLAENLKALRKTQLAQAAGVPRHTIGRYEKGLNCRVISNVIKLADYFNVTLEFLIRGL